jgi:hypothetical protein
MDASELTRRRKIRTEYVNNIYRLNSIAAGETNKPPTSGNQVFDKNGVDYTHWKNWITVGPTYVTQAELDAIFVPPAPPAPMPVYNATFAVFASMPTAANWVYRVYNATTNAWTALLDTGYSTATWNFQYFSSDKNYFCLVLNDGANTHAYIFVDAQGLIVNVLTVTTSSLNYHFAENYVFINDGTTLQVYDPITQVLQTTVLAINDYVSLENGIFLAGVTDGSNNTPYYIWPLGSTAPPILIVNHPGPTRGYSTYNDAYRDDLILLLTYADNTYADVVYVIFSNGTSASYTLPAGTYNDVYLRTYGINNRFSFLRCTADDNTVTYYTFPNVLGTITPKTLHLTNPWFFQEYYYQSQYASPTYDSNHLVITNYVQPTDVAYILTGGGPALFNGNYNDFLAGGNYMKVSAAKLVENAQRVIPYFIIDEGPYGTHKKYTELSGQFAGYVIGSNTEGNPHTSIVYVQNGIGQLGIAGRYAFSVQNSHYHLTSDTYSTAVSGSQTVSGAWWSIKREAVGDGPTNCEVWFTMEDVTHWSTQIDSYADYRQDNRNAAYMSSVDISGSNFVLGKVMLAATENNTIDDGEIASYVQAYVAGAVPNLFADPTDFTTINGAAYQTWHDLSGAQYLTNIAAPYVYTYNYGDSLPPPQFSEGTAYISLSGENFHTINYTAPHLLSKHIQINRTGVLIIEGNSTTDKQTSRLITAGNLTGSTVDLSGNLPTNPHPILDIAYGPFGAYPWVWSSQQNFLYLNTENCTPLRGVSLEFNWFPVGTSYFAIDNTNAIISQELFSSVYMIPFLINYYQSSNGSIAIDAATLVSVYSYSREPAYLFFLNGTVLVKYANYAVDQLYCNNYDNASGVIFGFLLNYNDTSNMVTMTNSSISGTTFTFASSYDDKSMAEDHLFIIGSPLIHIYTWDSTGTLYEYMPAIPIELGDYSYYSTTTKICWFFQNATSGVYFYVIFDFATHTYTDTISQSIENVAALETHQTGSYPYSL